MAYSRFQPLPAITGLLIAFALVLAYRTREIGTDQNVAADTPAAPPPTVSHQTVTSASPSVSTEVPILATAAPDHMPEWTVKFGAEFWRRSSRGGACGSTQNQQQAFLTRGQVANAIERVLHAFQQDARSGKTFLHDREFSAEPCSTGMRFQARQPAHPYGSVAELTFETRSVSRTGASIVPPCRGPWVTVGNTSQRLLTPDGGLVEHYEARSDGVEVTWVLREPPPGQGDMEMEVGVAGSSWVSQQGRGVAFRDQRDSARLGLGPVLVIDSAGQKWPAELAATASSARIRIAEAVLAHAAYPLAIDPLITPSFELDAPIDGPPLSTQASPAIAANSSGYFIVWTHGKGDASEAAVMGARLDSGGRLLDPYGLLLSRVAGEQTVCAVAAREDGFLAVWAAPRANSATDWDILAARVAPDGSVLDQTPVAVCAVPSSIQASPAVAANGDNYLVVWRDTRQSGIYGNLVTPDGRVSATNGFPISAAANDQYTPAVAALGTNYLVVWQDYRKATSAQFASDIYGARVTGTGVLLDTNGIAICTRTNSQFSPAVGANGEAWLVAWEDYDVKGNDILGARVSESGAVLDVEPLELGRADNAQAYPSVAGVTGTCVVAWQDYRQSTTNNYAAAIWANRVRPGGEFEIAGGFPVSSGAGGQWRPAGAVHDNLCLVAWQDATAYANSTLAEIRAAMLGLTNTVPLPEFLVSGSVNAELSPTVAASGTNVLAVWSDSRNVESGGRDLYGVRLNRDGSVLDTTAIPICTATNNQAEPALTSDGSDFLVAWADWRNTPANATHADIFGARVSASGVVLDPDGIAICTATNDQRFPAVALLGTNYLVVWQDPRRNAGGTILDVFGARVSPAGNVLDPAGIPISVNAGNQAAPAVTANTAQALVVWSDTRSGANAADIYGAHLNVEGSVLETNGFPICTASLVQTNPAVATDGQRFLAVWTDGRAGTTARFDVYGAFILMDGSVRPENGFPIRTGPAQQDGPGVVFNGLDYLVTWGEARDGTTNVFDNLGMGITAAGESWPGGALLLSPGAFTPYGASVTALPDGSFAVAKETLVYSTPRIMAQMADLEAMARFSPPSISNGQFVVQFRGRPGQQYRLETSNDLKTWQEFRTFILTNTSENLLEPMPAAVSAKYYRAVLLP